MANCLVTTLSETVNNANILAPDEFIIKINHISNSAPASARWMAFVFRSAATIRMQDESASYAFSDANGVSIGKTVGFTGNSEKVVFFPNPAVGSTYNVVVSNKYAIRTIRTDSSATTQYDFFEFSLRDLKYCTSLVTFICICHKLTGEIGDLKNLNDIDALLVSRSSVTGNIADLAYMQDGLHSFRGSYSDIYGDISVVAQLPQLRSLELFGCVEIHGNLSAFENHTSIYDLTFPQLTGHPSIEGDIESLSGCTSLSVIRALNEAKIYGDISALADLPLLWGVYLEGTGVSGDVASFAGNDHIQYLRLGYGVSNTYIGSSSDKVYGDIASFAGMSTLYSLGLENTGVTGDVGDLTGLDRLNIIGLTNTAVTGSITDFNSTTTPNLTTIDLGNCAGISGSLDDWAYPPNLQSLQINGTNVSGDIGTTLENCTTLTSININNTNVSGDITKVFEGTVMTTGYATGCIYLTGDLSQLPDNFYYFSSNGRGGGTYSWGTTTSRPSTSTVITFDGVDFGVDLENMLINQANCIPKNVTTDWTQKRMNVYGSNISATSMSSQCRAACGTLGQAGYVIYINDVLIEEN